MRYALRADATAQRIMEAVERADPAVTARYAVADGLLREIWRAAHLIAGGEPAAVGPGQAKMPEDA